MAKSEVNVILYAVELGELLEWIGCADDTRYQEAWQALQEDEDEDEGGGWEPRALPVLERLLKRIIYEGKLYEELDEDERYLVTQILIDLFDAFVDQDPLSEEMPLDRLQVVVDQLPRGSEAHRLAGFLIRGREVRGTRHLWEKGSAEDVGPYLGYVTREEAARLVEGLDAAMQRQKSRPSGLLKQLRNAADECARAELDLVSFIG